MNKDKMTPTPWKADGLQIQANGRYLLAAQTWIETVGEGQANASAMVSAVNYTYGQNINPIAVPELLRTLKNMCEYFDWLMQDPGFPAYREAKEAIEEAKL